MSVDVVGDQRGAVPSGIGMGGTAGIGAATKMSARSKDAIAVRRQALGQDRKGKSGYSYCRSVD